MILSIMPIIPRQPVVYTASLRLKKNQNLDQTDSVNGTFENHKYAIINYY